MTVKRINPQELAKALGAEACGGQATERAELERQIMNPNVPKNEREWWAFNEIECLREEMGRLRDKLVMKLPSEDDLAFLLWCESRHLTAAERSSPYWLECWEHESDPKREVGNQGYWPRNAARAILALLHAPSLTSAQ